MVKNKTRKKSNKKIKIDGFDNIPKSDVTVWATDQFGKRKVIDFDKFMIRQNVDNKILATDFKNDKKKLKAISEEYRRRLLLQIKKARSSRRLFEKKTRKIYKSSKAKKMVEKMPIKKVQNLYFELLRKHKPHKSRKK
tara:strand:+ start:68 stop:481 length:414 start_codon:yes stop_codon:yes gene_type:complete